jgi:hypothetical protein
MTQEAYHIHTGRKKRELFWLPFLSQKQASKHIALPSYWVASRRGRRRKAVQGYLVPVGLAEDWVPFTEERSAATVTFVNLLGVVLSSSHCWWQRRILFSYLLEIPEMEEKLRERKSRKWEQQEEGTAGAAAAAATEEEEEEEWRSGVVAVEAQKQKKGSEKSVILVLWYRAPPP